MKLLGMTVIGIVVLVYLVLVVGAWLADRIVNLVSRWADKEQQSERDRLARFRQLSPEAPRASGCQKERIKVS